MTSSVFRAEVLPAAIRAHALRTPSASSTSASTDAFALPRSAVRGPPFRSQSFRYSKAWIFSDV